MLNVNHGLPIGVAIAAALAAGVVIGLVNGFFVLYFRMNSLIVTMGVGTFHAWPDALARRSADDQRRLGQCSSTR